MSDDFKQGLYALVAMIGRDAVLESLEEDKSAAEKEVRRLEDAIAELS